MFQLINDILLEFKKCFKRTKTWQWFVVAVIGFMIRTDRRGITSIVSALKLKPRLYHTLLHFFRSNAYQADELSATWIKAAKGRCDMLRIAERVVLLGDHCKISKEGLRMPGIQKMHQDSQNSGKPEFIEGHNYGQVSAVITNGSVVRSLPLLTELQASPKKIEGTKKKDGDSLVTQMITLTNRAAKAIGEPVYVALDAYYSSEVAWTAADKTIGEDGVKLVEIVTRAQSNTVAYRKPEPPKKKRRGQPRKYGDKIVLYSLFADTSKFTQTNMVLYGKPTQVQYLCLDLVWMPVKKLVRFVLVKTDSGNCVLMSSDLTLEAKDIITIYALRFKIETSFDEQKNDMGSFAYHFWTTALPKRKKWKSNEPLTDERSQSRIAQTKQAIETFVCLNTIATGILTVVAFSHNREIWQYYPGWVRTLRSVIPTVATSKMSLSHVFHAFLPRYKSLPSFFCIIPLLRNDDYLYKFVA
jgi:hypothetical protein